MTRHPSRLAAVGCLVLLTALAGPAPVGHADDGAARAGSSTGLRSTYDGDAEGWVSQEAGDPATWVSVGGNPGGAMSVQRGSGAVTGLRSPASWAGSRTELLGGRLSFDLRLGPGDETSAVEVGLVPSTGSSDTIYTQVRDLRGPVASWTRVTLPIVGDGSWFKSGAAAGPAEFDATLSRLSYVYVASFTFEDTDTMYLDNVVLASKVARSLTLAARGTRFYGRLKPAGPCARGQRVSVLRVRPGPDTEVGTARTDRAGEYAVQMRDRQRGSYYARTDARFAEGGGDCSAARSPRLAVD